VFIAVGFHLDTFSKYGFYFGIINKGESPALLRKPSKFDSNGILMVGPVM
jgi:hypothetical protein